MRGEIVDVRWSGHGVVYTPVLMHPVPHRPGHPQLFRVGKTKFAER